MMRTSQIIFSFVFLGFMVLYIIISKSLISDLTTNKATETEFLSKPLNIDDTGVTEIYIDNKNWPEKKYLENHLLLVSLGFKFNAAFPTEQYDNNQLIIDIHAFSKFSKDNKLFIKDTLINRLIPINYASSNTIVLKNSKQNNGSIVNGLYNRGYPLGVINNFHFRDFNTEYNSDNLTVKLNIIKGDPNLNKLTPRLLIQEYKTHMNRSDMFGIAFTKIVLDVILILCIIFLLILFLSFIKFRKFDQELI
jgi:hypothetical protein